VSADDSPKPVPVSNAGAEPPAAVRSPPMRKWRLPLMLIAPLVVVAGVIYVFVFGGRYESTDDAYIQAATVSVSSNVPGRVVEMDVHDNQIVHRGQTLFRLDDAPYRIAVDEAEANLASARLRINSLKSTYRQRQSELQAARDTLDFERQQFERNKRLLASGIVSRAAYDQAEHALASAREQLAGAQQQVDAVAADLGGNPNIELDRHPMVQQAQAALDRARLNLSYTVVNAATDGVVSKVDQLQVGDYISASVPLFALVSNHDVWVEANFKEVQLAHMKAGQTATVKIDRFPDRHFVATVVSMSPATGSQSSLLPPENATGNWVKVVQRVPVRLQLDGGKDLPLQAGLSAIVRIDTESKPQTSTPAQPQTDTDGRALSLNRTAKPSTFGTQLP
jgi:membrane fusion protein (multidrug efflux system)